MEKKKSAIIIGAGIGGITTALYLSKNGWQVNVYEKNSFPGGRCSHIIRDGHRFDTGATMMLMPDIYRMVFDSLGLKIEEVLDIISLKELYTIFFDDNSKLVFSSDKELLKQQLDKIEKGSFNKAIKYVSTGYKLYKLAFNKILGKNFYRLRDFINFNNLLLLLKLKVYLKHSTYTRRFFKNNHLQMAFTFQNIYVGQSPFKSPALFSMIPSAELSEGSYFPAGGMYQVTERLISLAKEYGTGFHFNKQVSKINVYEKKIRSIQLIDGSEANADIIVANADLPYVYRELLPPGCKSKRLEKMKYSCSAMVFHWGLDKLYPQLGQHNVFLSDNYKSGLNKIFKDKSVSDTPSFYVHSPVRSDTSAAPEGCDSLSVIIAAGHLDKKYKQDWEHLREITRNAVLKRLRHLGITDIEKHIKFEIFYSPADWVSTLNISRGSVFGSLAHNIFQMGYFRPHNRHRKYKNLYFTGGSTHPGNGVPMVLLSAKLVAERILTGK